jgi:solute carrier family 25 protein 42
MAVPGAAPTTSTEVLRQQRETMDKEKVPMSNLLINMAAGSMAGAVAKTTIAPLDRTKIYFQTHPEKRYRIGRAFNFLKMTYTNTGLLSLWRGNTATMARIVPYAGIQFTSHEQYKRVLGITEEKKRPGFRNFLAGSLAGLTGQSLTYPLDRARAVMAVTEVGEYKNLWAVFKRIYWEEGLLAFYTGFRPAMCGVVFYAGCSFFTYESLKYNVTDSRRSNGEENPQPNAWERLGCGAFAGLCGQGMSYPLEIVRRRMQTARQMGMGANKYTSIAGTLAEVLR